jgi:hypothetical protein
MLSEVYRNNSPLCPGKNEVKRVAREQDFLDRVYVTSDNIIRREIAGEIILVPIRDNIADMQQIFALDEVSDFVWNQIDGSQTVREIGHTIPDFFEVEETQVLDDMDEFIQQLLQERLINKVG